MTGIMDEAFSRTGILIGSEGLARLASSRVAIFGLGGVGSWAAEGLARAGIGSFLLVDNDVVGLSNINRQVLALRSTVGRGKAEVMKERILEINPDARVEARQVFYSGETADELLVEGLSYAIDAIDTIASKLDLIMRASAKGIPMISAMGAGNKLDPTAFEVADIYDTSICPLARVIRRELRQRGLKGLKVVYSKEEPIEVDEAANPIKGVVVHPHSHQKASVRRSMPGSVSFVPPVVGFIIAGEVVKDILASRPFSL
jgi:tRNA A37 threonylcarbamoyladenosine dehydratase